MTTTTRPAGPVRVLAGVLTAFTAVFISEWGDLTQITTANLAATNGWLPTAIGSAAALMSVSALALVVGRFIAKKVPLRPSSASAASAWRASPSGPWSRPSRATFPNASFFNRGDRNVCGAYIRDMRPPALEGDLRAAAPGPAGGPEPR